MMVCEKKTQNLTLGTVSRLIVDVVEVTTIRMHCQKGRNFDHRKAAALSKVFVLLRTNFLLADKTLLCYPSLHRGCIRKSHTFYHYNQTSISYYVIIQNSSSLLSVQMKIYIRSADFLCLTIRLLLIIYLLYLNLLITMACQ